MRWDHVVLILALLFFSVSMSMLIVDVIWSRWVEPWAWRSFAKRRGIEEAEFRQYIADLKEDKP